MIRAGPRCIRRIVQSGCYRDGIVNKEWLHLLVEIHSSKLCQQHQIVARAMHLEIINVACSIELSEDFDRVLFRKEFLYIDTVRAIAKHAGIVAAI